jgi:hypothetical protein
MSESIVLASLRGVIEDEVDGQRRNPKRMGELSEAAFLLRAQSLGLHVAKPWGDSERYDFIVDSGERRWRVQIKSTETIRARGYEVQAIYSVYGKGKCAYTKEEIDVLAVHIVPLDVWYLLPVEVFVPCKTLRFYPDIECSGARWEGYRETWEVVGAV